MNTKLNILKSGEEFSPRTNVDVEAMSVSVLRKSVHPSLDDGSNLILDWTFDWSNTPMEEILRRATNDLVITVRREVTAAKAKELPALVGPRTIDPMDFHTTRESKVVKVSKAALTMSADERRELMEQIAASLEN